MKTYIKNNGMGRIYLIGYHPMKDWVAISSGLDDIRWVGFDFFTINYSEEI